MKRFVCLLIVLLSCSAVNAAEFSEKEMKKMKRSVKILSVSDRKIKNKKGEKVLLFKLNTYQNEDYTFKFRLRVTVEITDKNGDTYFSQAMKSQGGTCSDYYGEDYWEFQIDYGELERPKVTAFVLQYGIWHENEFLPLCEEFDDVDSLEELQERSTVRLPIKMTKHEQSYLES